MSVTLNRPSGLHILAKVTLAQMAADENLAQFAGGLIPRSLDGLDPEAKKQSLAAVLHTTRPQFYGLLVALLILEAEISAVVDDETRRWPLPGFMTYRSRFPLEQYPLNMVRLPPLNEGGHYILSGAASDHWLAVRMDLHPQLKITGRVRVAIGSPARPPQRIQPTEHRLDRQELTPELIEAALTAAHRHLSPPLRNSEWAELHRILHALRRG